jgi:hypothetical protein
MAESHVVSALVNKRAEIAGDGMVGEGDVKIRELAMRTTPWRHESIITAFIPSVSQNTKHNHGKQ